MADGNITVELSTKAAQSELERLRAENSALKRDLQYARDGLTKGRTRMREDNERLRAALASMTADRDSWADQASQRTQDALDLMACERERCAKIAESLATEESATTCANVAAAIRGA